MCRNNDNIIHRRHCCPDWNLARLAAKSSSCFASNSSSVNPDCSNFETFFSRSWDIKDEVWYLTKRIDNTFCCCLWSLRTLSTSGANVVKPRRYKTYEGVSNNSVSAYALLAQWLCVQERWFSYSPVRIFHSPLRILNGWILQWIWSLFKAIAVKVESCSPTQHSITKSRVSLAHTTSLGNSSTGGEENERWGIERRWDFTDQRSSWQRWPLAEKGLHPLVLRCQNDLLGRTCWNKKGEAIIFWIVDSKSARHGALSQLTTNMSSVCFLFSMGQRILLIGCTGLSCQPKAISAGAHWKTCLCSSEMGFGIQGFSC